MSAIWEYAYAFVADREKGFQKDPRDSGNWTGGVVGQGELRGTNGGISAASYPALDIEHLTPDQIKAIAYTDYWLKVWGDSLPPALAVVALDCAFNQGVGAAIRLMQAASGAVVDGVLGPATMAAVKAKDPKKLIARFTALRCQRYARGANFALYGADWMDRACSAAIAAVTYG